MARRWLTPRRLLLMLLTIPATELALAVFVEGDPTRWARFGLWVTMLGVVVMALLVSGANRDRRDVAQRQAE